MRLPIDWESEGVEKDELIFQKKFKILRGHAQPETRRVSEEECYGVLYYRPTPEPTATDEFDRLNYGQIFNGISGIIDEIVAPFLTLFWARQVVEMLEQGMFRASYSSCLLIEDELRRRGYDGGTLCAFYVADVIGFQVMKEMNLFSTVEIEAFGEVEGQIEKYLTNRGYCWIAELKTWQNAEGGLWNRRKQTWEVSLPLPDSGSIGVSKR